MEASQRIDRLVVRAPNWLGDAVLAIPAMAALRDYYRESHLTVAAPASVAAVFRERTPVAPDHVLELPARPRQMEAALRSGRFDAGILFPNSFRSAWVYRRAGIRDRWGFSTHARGFLLTRRVKPPSSASALHQAEFYRELVRGLGIACPADTLPALEPSEASMDLAERLLGLHRWSGAALVALLPGAAYGQAKQWPADRMAELALRLRRERGVTSVLLGAAHDRPAARAIESWLRGQAPNDPPSVIDLVGHTSLGALAGVLARASVCVSNDSGGMHLASALGVPVVAIFGPTDERVTRPAGDHDLMTEPVFCRPCMLRDCPIDHRCMKRIGVDRVFGAVAARLAARGGA